MRVRIRLAGPGDAERLSLVASASFLETFAGLIAGEDILAHCKRRHSEKFYAELLVKPESRSWLAEAEPGDAPVGYAVLDEPDLPVEPRAGNVEVERIYLLHRFQGGGVGFRLMSAGLDWARRAGKRRALLGVYERNETAISFYHRVGFRQIGERKFQVGDSWHDDVVMALDL